MENNQNANAQANAQVVQTTTTNTQPQANNVGSNASNVNYDDIFKKLDSILDKRSEGIAKSALKDNGYEDEELKEILTQYRASKEAKSNEATTTITTLQSELAKAKSDLQEEKLNSEALRQARSLNVDEKTVPYLVKLADFKEAFDDKGVIVPDKVKKALETVLNDVPGFKAKEESGTKGVTVGADTTNSSQPSGNIFGFNFTGVRKHD